MNLYVIIINKVGESMITSNIKIELKKDIKSVWQIVSDNSNYQWRSDVKRLDIINEKEFIEYDYHDFKTHFKITNKEMFRQYEFDIDNKNLRGHWIGIFIETSQGCILDFTETIEVKNPIMKLMAKSFLKKQQNVYMNDLKKKINEGV